MIYTIFYHMISVSIREFRMLTNQSCWSVPFFGALGALARRLSELPEFEPDADPWPRGRLGRLGRELVEPSDSYGTIQKHSRNARKWWLNYQAKMRGTEDWTMRKKLKHGHEIVRLRSVPVSQEIWMWKNTRSGDKWGFKKVWVGAPTRKVMVPKCLCPLYLKSFGLNVQRSL